MSGDPEWFAPKRYGFGAGLPIAWQGWAIMLGFGAILLLVFAVFIHKPIAMAAIVIPLMLLFTVIAARTTRGGWRWRWGKED